VEHRDEIDAMIQTWSEHWSLARIGLVERNILRLAIYELLFGPELPPNVVINEAVEVAKRYGAQEAGLFINGILDRIKHEVTPQRAAGMLQDS
jgi:N utilization substance protein B